MTMQLDDPRLTAYALGELDDDRERAQIEAFLARSEEARRLVGEIRAAASLLESELAAEPALALTGAQRERVERQRERRDSTSGYFWVGAAAILILGVSLASWWTFSAPDVEVPAVASAPERPLQMTVGPPSPPAALPPSAEPIADARNPGELYSLAPVPVPPGPRAPEPQWYAIPRGIEGAVPGGVVGGVVGGSPQSDPATLQRLQSLGYLSGGGSGGGVAADPYLDIHRARPPFHTEAYDRFEDNPFLDVVQNPLSTFSIDVDTASYANVRRFITQSSFPPRDAVRIEEMVNYFDYDYPAPEPGVPFSVNVEIADAPWTPGHRLMRIGLKGTPVDADERPPLNLVFLLDVSGSMQPPNKLPLLKRAMRLLVDELTESDHISIVVYAGASGLVLPRTSGAQTDVILAALDRLHAGGSTNGGAGIQLAYDNAVASFIEGGINRVVLATDGDFNVGVTSQGELIRLIEEKAESGVFLSVLGFGIGNYKDSTLEKLADRGNGNYAYIDTLSEARKVLVREMGSTLVTIAKDVKIQIELNPAEVSSYRLIGYENRMLRAEDFNDDQKDAGEIGAGHTVTALYELVPKGSPTGAGSVDPLKYQERVTPSEKALTGELLTVKLRYKEPDGETSKLLVHTVRDDGKSYASASGDFKFAAAVAAFGMILRDSPHKGGATLESVLELAEEGMGRDEHGYRAELVELVRRARSARVRQPR